MRILGIDHGSRTGWCLNIDGIVTETGNVQMDTSKEQNIIKYCERIRKLMMLKEPDIIALEEPKHIRNAKIFRFLLMLYSAIKIEAYKLNIKVIEINPKTMKKFITGNGNADKKEVMDSLLSIGIDSDLIVNPQLSKRNPDKILSYYYDESDATALTVYATDIIGDLGDLNVI